MSNESPDPLDAPAQPAGENFDTPSAPQSVPMPGFFPPDLIVARLSEVRHTQPVAALAAANQHRDTLTNIFIQAVAQAVANPGQDFTEHGMLFNYATYFLAKWREARAWPLFLQWFSLPGEAALDLGGDTVTHHGARFLASVCGGNTEGLQTLITNREANPICRGQAILALAILAAWGERSREEVESYFLELARQGLEPGTGALWHDLLAACVGMEFLSVFPELRRACQEGLVAASFCTPDQLDYLEKAPRGEYAKGFADRYPPIVDIAHETRWWAGFQQAQIASGPAPAPGWGGSAGHRQPYISPKKVGRNDPCPCGSGKKHKKCCGR